MLWVCVYVEGCAARFYGNRVGAGDQLNQDKQEPSELPPTPLTHQEARAPVFREPSAREVCKLAER